MKRYFRIPEGSRRITSNVTVSNLVDGLMRLGLKVGEINRLMSLFALIMNINQADMVPYKRERKVTYKVKDNSIIRSNLDSILGKELLNDLEADFNKFEKESDCTIDNIRIKQEILMRMIWEESVLNMAQTINQKLFDETAEFTPDVRKMVFIEFPAIGYQFQATVENYLLSKINAFIKEVAFKLPTSCRPSDIDLDKSQHIYEKIKQGHTYDFNKKIISDLEKEKLYETQL